MLNDDERTKKAEDLRKQGNFPEALTLYENLYQESHSAYHLHWLIHCLRKSGQLDKAYETGQLALSEFPNDKYICSEMGWIIYEHSLKPAKEEKNFRVVVESAEKALQINPDNELLLNRVIQIVMKSAKEAGNPDWKTVTDFAEKINPERLSAEKRITSNNKFYMSEREEWYVNTANAFLKSKNYPKAIEIAEKGLSNFPNEIFLIRTIAWSLFQSGQKIEAADKMRTLLSHPNCGWYIKSELAQIELSLIHI